MRFHRLQNVQIALDFLKQRQVWETHTHVLGVLLDSLVCLSSSLHFIKFALQTYVTRNRARLASQLAEVSENYKLLLSGKARERLTVDQVGGKYFWKYTLEIVVEPEITYNNNCNYHIHIIIIIIIS